MSEQSGQPDINRKGTAPSMGMRPEETTQVPGDAGQQGGGESAREKAAEYSDVAREKASEYSDVAREKAGEYGEKAREQADMAKQQAASGMERVAGAVRERSEGANGSPAAQAGVKVADSMENAAGYLRSHDVNQMWSDVEAYAREHPAQALAGAVLTGFLVGRIIR